MLEAFKSIKQLRCDEKCQIIAITLDNKKLMRMMKKGTYTAANMTQDAGAILSEIINIKTEIKTNLEFEYFPGDIEKPDKYENNPVAYLMAICDEKSKERRTLIMNRDIENITCGRW